MQSPVTYSPSKDKSPLKHPSYSTPPTFKENTPRRKKRKSPPTIYETPPKHINYTDPPTCNENTPNYRKRKSPPTIYESPTKLSPSTQSDCPPKENLLVEHIPCNDHLHACKTDVPSEMKAILPEGYSYRVKTYENKKPEIFCGATKLAFDATIFCNIFSEQEVMKWLRMFQDKSFCTYQVTRGTKTTGFIFVYKTVRHCQHFRKYVSRQGMKNTKSNRQKKTQCPSTLTIKIYSSRSTIKKRLQFPSQPPN